jgi:uncharacterized membrane protein
MRQHSNDLFTVMVIAGLSALLVMVMPTNSIVRIIFALPLVFFLPGYAITTALLPRHSFGKAELLLFSLGISVAMTALSGLALNLTAWGLQTSTWAITLAMIVWLASAIAWLRRRQGSPITASQNEILFKLRFRDGLLLGLAVLVTGAAIGLTRLPAAPNDVAGYTLLWMVPVNPGNINGFRLGIDSAEFTETRYRLQVSVGDQVVQEWPELRLKPGETWETTIELQSDQVGPGSIVADLYKLDDPQTIYRHVKVWRGE